MGDEAPLRNARGDHHGEPTAGLARWRAAAHRPPTARHRRPVSTMNGLIDRTFTLPQGDPRYAANALTPGAAPFEPCVLGAAGRTSSASTSSRSARTPPASTGATRRRARCAGWSATIFGREALALVRRAQRAMARLRIRREPRLWRLLRHQPRPRRPVHLEGLLRKRARPDRCPCRASLLRARLNRDVADAGRCGRFSPRISAQRESGGQRLTFAHPARLAASPIFSRCSMRSGSATACPASCRSSA